MSVVTLSKRFSKQPFYLLQVRYRTANAVYTVYLYCYLVNHAWVFNEGVIQFTMVYFVFAPKTKYQYYVLFAYAFPILPLVVYIICATKLDPIEEGYWHGADYSWENIVSGSGYVLVGLNLFIMSYLIYIIVKKLRTARSPRHRKALATARSFTMLVFLLGIINLFGINWREPADLQEKGSLVCLFYVFLSPGAWKQLAKKFRQRKGRQFSRRKNSNEPGKTNRNLIESRLPRRLPCTTNSSVSTRASIESEDSQKEICKDLHQEKREAPVTLIGMVVNKTNM
ncbi:pituitary adenylate cyclase-activating polypeptide type I receptor-like isoform X2 [Hydractinia symbiolongicarpus]|uniref:pituitary adenylate cyclase-activating polypeptide type I receptor-like isoform X2 n=1 Tax=Hydractinia symbiolongicarpus TaxID=13093 RepID=UPI00254E00DC|nr:pituitary adenylate cyclase-activating polypeptide type I receptor-like isoform X2 [Hydractinia symbiolongicarpus]